MDDPKIIAAVASGLLLFVSGIIKLVLNLLKKKDEEHRKSLRQKEEDASGAYPSLPRTREHLNDKRIEQIHNAVGQLITAETNNQLSRESAAQTAEAMSALALSFELDSKKDIQWKRRMEKKVDAILELLHGSSKSDRPPKE